MLKVNDRKVKENDEIDELFNEHFVSIGGKLAREIDPADISPTQHVKQTESKFRFRKISSIKVFNTLKKLKNGKSTGLFHMPNKALNIAKDLIATSLADIFNACIETEVFTDDLKISKVMPTFKSERKDDLNDYRPITLLPTVARVMERLIYKQIYDYFNTEKLLNKNQWGFRSLHSTVLALSDCSSDWLFSMDKGMINYAVFLDIRKAFYTVDNKILLDKLFYYRIEEDELSFFKSYLSDRTQCCSINGVKLKFRSSSCDVPKGSMPSPLLFITYMNDLPNSVEGTKIKMYADDTNLAKQITSLSEVKEEQSPEFEKVIQWLKANKLSLNTLKTEFMLFGGLKCLKDTTNLIAFLVGDRDDKPNCISCGR